MTKSKRRNYDAQAEQHQHKQQSKAADAKLQAAELLQQSAGMTKKQLQDSIKDQLGSIQFFEDKLQKQAKLKADLVGLLIRYLQQSSPPHQQQMIDLSQVLQDMNNRVVQVSKLSTTRKPQRRAFVLRMHDGYEDRASLLEFARSEDEASVPQREYQLFRANHVKILLGCNSIALRQHSVPDEFCMTLVFCDAGSGAGARDTAMLDLALDEKDRENPTVVADFMKFKALVKYLLEDVGVPCPTTTVVSGDGLSGTEAGKSARFSVVCRDACHKELATDEIAIEAKLLDRGTGQVHLVDVNADAENSSLWTCFYTLFKAGEYFLRIYSKSRDESHEQHSIELYSQNVTIHPGPVYLPHCEAALVSKPKKTARAGEQVTITATMRDAFGNAALIDSSKIAFVVQGQELPCRVLPLLDSKLQVLEMGGQLELCLSFKRVGACSISLLCDGHNIGSDIHLQIKAARAARMVLQEEDSSFVCSSCQSNPISLPIHVFDDFGNEITRIADERFSVQVRFRDLHGYYEELLARTKSWCGIMVKEQQLMVASFLWAGEYTVAISLDDSSINMNVVFMVNPSQDEEQRYEMLLDENRCFLDDRLSREVAAWSFGLELPDLLNEVTRRYRSIEEQEEYLVDSNRITMSHVGKVYRSTLLLCHPDHLSNPSLPRLLEMTAVFRVLQDAKSRFK